MKIEKKLPIDRRDYYKKYYTENKEKMYQKQRDLVPTRTKRMLIEKLNAGGYKRIPYEKISRFNLVFNEETQKYE